MRLRCALALVLVPILGSAVDRPTHGALNLFGDGFTCPNTQAATTASSVLETGDASLNCPDTNIPCGYVVSYTPPATNCNTTVNNKCCKSISDQAYTQPFTCNAQNQCVGGTKTFHGQPVTVYTDATCTSTACQ